jgi:subtilisin family serine protease
MMQAAMIAGLFASAMAAPITSLVPLTSEGEIIPGEYIVTFKNTVDVAVAREFADKIQAKNFYNIEGGKDVFRGFSGAFSEEQVEALRLRTDLFESIEVNQVARTSARQTNPPSWGLGASSNPSAATNPGYYDYPDQAGAGIKVYVMDTGIRTTHVDFEGRAIWGARFGQGGFDDGNGHGTHCAGTVGGASYGIAKRSTLVAVGVLGPTGSGSYDDVISGINWSASNCTAKCVGSMSLGGGASSAVDNAVNAFVVSTRFMAVAAGNSNTNAQNTSPARAADAYTVMATDSAARKASYSNYGSVCSTWAPGSSITSTWSTSNTATNTISGTSMACPHVAGAGALAFGTNKYPNQSNDLAMELYLNSIAKSNFVSGVPSGTVNRFSFVSTSM